MGNDLATPTATLARAIDEAQRAILTQATPPHIVKRRVGKGRKTFSYVEHAWVTEQLNLAFGWNWDWEIVEWRLFPSPADATECMVLGRLTVRTERGSIVKQQFGSKDNLRSKEGYLAVTLADALKSASSDALKKCASLLGLALDLYSEDIDRYVPAPVCADCDCDIQASEKHDAEYIAEWTRRRYGRQLCADCFQAEAERLNGADDA